RRSRRRGVVSRRRRNYGGTRRSRDGGRTRMATGSVPKLKVLVFGASLREDSLNRKLAALAARVVEQCGGAEAQASMRDFEAPSYDGDVERAQGIPHGAAELRRRLIECDALIVASPEYNASMPGVLKNLIDWTSRF